ncbi:hypothetical protein O7627_24450 [Solwaraspora sp. WMMD1047]|uniref:hypothetical protein n=1 Tax=Solwaraspora sp. WMMD1047 TaxID=3016102 RepID=UPI002415C835|nr:hypothetical protein [Solwaraspora sp. WMMD1047]MDG4832435.1 hypothetical protein [Solwaraspora sp. WMMD1047]
MPEYQFEMLVDGSWVDITSDVRVKGGVTITRGYSERGGVLPEPGTLTIGDLRSPNGKYSPRNPRSEYYGRLGRNTPIRARVVGESPDNWLTLQGYPGAAAYTADHASLDITGDIDVRFDGAVWNRDFALVTKYLTTGNQRSWLLRLTSAGHLQFIWSPDGTFASQRSEVSSVPVPAAFGERFRVRATLDVNNGAGGHTVAFYVSDGDLAGTWTPLGITFTTTGTTSIYSSTADLYVVQNDPVLPAGRVYEVQVRSSIGGTIVARPDWRDSELGETSQVDTAGRTWLIGAGAVVDDPAARIVAEVSEWPPEWDTSGRDVSVALTASGILRRLGQGRKPLRSPIYRNLVHRNPVAWWTCEDGGTATRMSTAAPNGSPAVISDVTFETDPTLLGASGVAVLGPAGSIIGQASPHASTNSWTALWFARLTALPASTTRLMTITSTGTAHTWTLDLQSNGLLTISAIGTSGLSTVVLSTDDVNVSGSVAAVDEEWVAFTLLVFQNGGNVNWAVNFHAVGDGPQFFTSGTNSFAGQAGAFRSLRITVDSVLAATNPRVSHLFATNGDLPFVTFSFAEAASAHNGELAAERFLRLCGEQGVPAIVIGDPADSQPMGPQGTKRFLDLLGEVSEADGGFIVETRGNRSLSYRTGRSLYNQAPITLDYAAGEIMPPLRPVDDDALVANDVTVSRPAGASYRSVQETGPLNVQDPEDDPDGVGVYDVAAELILATDSQLQPAADWRRHGGTLDESRYPQVGVRLTGRAMASNPALAAAAAAADTGDLLRLTSLPEHLPPDEPELLVRGYVETLRPSRREITWNAAPGRLHRVGELGATTRLDTGGSETTADFDAGTDTSMTVQRASGTRRLWITTADRPQDFPFDIEVAGVRLTVTGITGSTDPQTLNVDAAPVNGITKTIPSGSRVTATDPWRLAR